MLAQLWARRFGRSMMYVSIVVSFIVLLVELDLVAIGIEDKGGVVVRAVLRTEAGRAVVAASGRQPGSIIPLAQDPGAERGKR